MNWGELELAVPHLYLSITSITARHLIVRSLNYPTSLIATTTTWSVSSSQHREPSLSVCLSVCPARPAISNKNYYQSIDINSNGFIINLQFMCIVDSICEIMYSPLSHRILPVVERWSVHVPRSKPLSKCTLNGNKCYKAISPGSWVLTFTRFDPSRIQQVGWKSFKEPPHWDLTENWLRPNWDLTETWRIHDWDLRTWLRPDWDLTDIWLRPDETWLRFDWDLTETWLLVQMQFSKSLEMLEAGYFKKFKFVNIITDPTSVSRYI